MMLLRIRRHETRNDAVHPPGSGSNPSGCSVVSNANTADASSARDAPAKIAAMPTSAAMRMSMPHEGNRRAAPAPSSAPIAPPIVNSGASVPPLVPLPSAIDQDMNFHRHSVATKPSVSLFEMMSEML